MGHRSTVVLDEGLLTRLFGDKPKRPSRVKKSKYDKMTISRLLSLYQSFPYAPSPEERRERDLIDAVLNRKLRAREKKKRGRLALAAAVEHFRALGVVG